MTYIPNPIDTSKIELSDDIIKLTEMLAKNAHDIWASMRINEGWKYGLERNDILKEHPCIVEYEKLPEIEKEYDRNMAIQTIKAILSSGYNIKKNESK